ncbi:MAG TPA: radical SAM protein [Acidimicrobiales bacterium]
MSATRGLLADTLPFSNVDGPGNRFVVFMQGCNFDCQACHNPQTIPTTSAHARWATVPELLDEIRGPAPFLSGVTVSGGEATQQWEFMRDLFAALRHPSFRGLTTMVDTNGSAPVEVWDELAPVMDGAMVDLKAFDDDLHQRLTGQSNAPVLAAIEHLTRLGLLYEVRLLLAPGVNDDPAMLARTAEWLHSVDPAMRVKIIGFRRHGARAVAREWDESTPEHRDAAAAVLAAAGLLELCTV